MARVKCLNCDTPMKKDGPLVVIGKNRYRFYTCSACGRTRSIKAGEAYKSPSQRRINAIHDNRLAKRWATKASSTTKSEVQ